MTEIENSKYFLTSNFDEYREKYVCPLEQEYFKTRKYEENKRFRSDGEYQRDYARVMYASAFRRMQGKMQLIGIKNDQFFRNRLTHSLEVAQIARSIANTLGYNQQQVYVVETGALAHDIGNPPFGHSGERKLDKLFADIGGFEGNAQTLRVLTNVEKKRPDFRGLNLTYRSLLSVVKYFKKKSISNNKFVYNEDYFDLKKFIDIHNIRIRTLDVQIVDVADEIAYAAHDLEDGLRIGAFTCDELLHDVFAQIDDETCTKRFEEIIKEAQDKVQFKKSSINSSQYSKLFRQELCSSLINMFINDVDFVRVDEKKKKVTGTQQENELGFHDYGQLVYGLKNIVYQCINHNDKVYDYENRGNTVLEFLKEFYLESPLYLPPEYRADEQQKLYLDLEDVYQDTLQKRLICDYISGMMENFAIEMYEKYSGKKF